MLRPHGGPQNHLLWNATIIAMFRMYLNRFLYPSFWCNTSILAVALEHHRKIFPFVDISIRLDPVGSPKQFVTECHHNSSILYQPKVFGVTVRFCMYQEMFLWKNQRFLV